MNTIIDLFTSVMDNIWFKWFFAAWTGVYLVQTLRGKTSNQELSFIAIAFVITLFVLPQSNGEST